MRGAEAVVKAVKMIGMKAVRKSRVPKAYRVQALDRRLRAERSPRRKELSWTPPLRRARQAPQQGLQKEERFPHPRW